MFVSRLIGTAMTALTSFYDAPIIHTPEDAGEAVVYKDSDGDYWHENDDGLYDLWYRDGMASETLCDWTLSDVVYEYGPIFQVTPEEQR